MKRYTYACFELRINVKDYDINVKIPFDNDVDALTYIDKHLDGSFHKRVWLEYGR